MNLPVLLIVALVAWVLLTKQPQDGDSTTAGAVGPNLYPPGMAPPSPPMHATSTVRPIATSSGLGGPVGVIDPGSAQGQAVLNNESANYERNGPEGEASFDRFAIAVGGPVGLGLVGIKDALEATIGHAPQPQVGFKCGPNSPDPSNPIPCTTAPPTQQQLAVKYRSKSSSNHIVGQK